MPPARPGTPPRLLAQADLCCGLLCWGEESDPCLPPTRGSRVGQQLTLQGAALRHTWKFGVAPLGSWQVCRERRRGVSIILRTPATRLHSCSLLHPQLHSPAPTSGRCSRDAESRLCGSTPAPLESHFLAQSCPSPAAALSSLRTQLDQSGKTSWCSPQLVPPQIPAAQLRSLATPSGPPGAEAGSQPSPSVLGDPPTSQPQAGQGNWGSPNWGSNW